MRLTRLQWSATLLAFVAIALLLLVHWVWAWPFIIASYVCSGASIRRTWREHKLRRVAEAEWLPTVNEPRKLELVDGRRRPFEPFCECPRCGVPTWHVFSGPHERSDSHAEWRAGPGRVRADDDEEVRLAVWNKEGTYRIHHRHEGWMEMVDVMVKVIDRECLSCGHKWEELPS